MILTLTPNAAVDVTVTTPSIARGGTTVVPGAARRAGGKAVNVARVLHSQGIDVHAVAPVGREDLAWFGRDLGEVPHTLVPTAAPTRTSYALVETDDDVTTILNERGAERTPQEWDAVLDACAAQVARADVLVVSGSLPPGTPADLLDRVVALARSTAHPVPVILDCSGEHLLRAARLGADVVKPNEAELVSAVGDLPPLEGARELQRLGARLVVVSLGADGLLVVPPERDAVRARLTAPLHGNPTGAGDAAVAAIASVLAQARAESCDVDLIELTHRALTWSAAAVLMPRAGEIHPDHAALRQQIQGT